MLRVTQCRGPDRQLPAQAYPEFESNREPLYYIKMLWFQEDNCLRCVWVAYRPGNSIYRVGAVESQLVCRLVRVISRRAGLIAPIFNASRTRSLSPRDGGKGGGPAHRRRTQPVSAKLAEREPAGGAPSGLPNWKMIRFVELGFNHQQLVGHGISQQEIAGGRLRKAFTQDGSALQDDDWMPESGEDDSLSSEGEDLPAMPECRQCGEARGIRSTCPLCEGRLCDNCGDGLLHAWVCARCAEQADRYASLGDPGLGDEPEGDYAIIRTFGEHTGNPLFRWFILVDTPWAQVVNTCVPNGFYVSATFYTSTPFVPTLQWRVDRNVDILMGRSPTANACAPGGLGTP